MVALANFGLALPPSPDHSRWFTAYGCVRWRGTQADVMVGGSLLGTFGPRDHTERNLMLVTVMKGDGVKPGPVSRAFGVTTETIRRLRVLEARDGIEAVAMRRGRGGSSPKLSKRQLTQLEKWFAAGVGPTEVHRRTTAKVALITVRRAHRDWRARTAKPTPSIEGAASTASSTVPVETTLVLPRQQLLPAPVETVSEQPLSSVEDDDQGDVLSVDSDVDADATDVEDATTDAEDADTDVEGAAGEDGVDPIDVVEREVQSCGLVQHVGSWMLLAMVWRLGLFEDIGKCWRMTPACRVVTEAFIVALAIGKRCVEGVRQLQTPSASVLLRAQRAPSASWVRRVWKDLATKGATWRLHFRVAGRLVRDCAERADGPVVFYVDNHMRTYTGKEVIRKGWKMQDKRALPGTSDYYVHDSTGRPLFRIDVPSHDSLGKWLRGITHILRTALGPKQEIVLAFDRAGAFSNELAGLRDIGVSFVTYERAPYQTVPESHFENSCSVDGVPFLWTEPNMKNLGKGRGRVRRVLVRSEKGQLNILAVGTLSAPRLIEVMKHRWWQENAFKHGNERWGINQLDDRQVETTPEDTIIPNPARRRLDNELSLAKVREGKARNQLARLDKDDPKRQRWQDKLAEAIADEKRLEALRPETPTHAAVKDTELAGELVFHTGRTKSAFDAIRIVCANAESELAYELAPHLRKPKEAKKHLAALFAAPGAVKVNQKTVDVTLMPAGTVRERAAFAALCKTVNSWKLAMPGDRAGRTLRFEVQL